MDPGQVPNSNAYNNPQQVSQPYPTQQYPPGVYQQAQGNPYSKTYTQPSPQHGYMPPRQ